MIYKIYTNNGERYSIEADYFTSDGSGISVFKNDGGVVAQKGFLKQVSATTPDADGGARALSVASDELITEILAWIVQNYKAGMQK